MAFLFVPNTGQKQLLGQLIGPSSGDQRISTDQEHQPDGVTRAHSGSAPSLRAENIVHVSEVSVLSSLEPHFENEGSCGRLRK